MTVVLDDTGQRALITDTRTGQVMRVSVPTAKENVELGKGIYVHGEVAVGKPVELPPVAVEPVIQLREEDVLDLPAPLPEPAPEPDAKRVADIAAALDLLNEHDFVLNGERKGKPKCSAIENIVGYPVGKDEVDALWDVRG